MPGQECRLTQSSRPTNGIDPTTGFAFDDTFRSIAALDLTAADRHEVLEGSMRLVYPRLNELLDREP